VDSRSPSTSIDRYGRLVLLAVFVVMLGGRFTLDRLGDFPSWDLRWAALIVVGLLYLIGATSNRSRADDSRTGSTFVLFLAWAGWMIATAGWAPRDARYSAVALDFALLIAFVWIGWGVAARVSRRVLISVWWWLYIAGWVYLAGALAAGPGVQGRYAAFGGGPNVFVRVEVLAFLAALVLAATLGKRWVLVGLPAFLVGAVLSGSRGGLLAMAVMLLVGAVPLGRRLGRRTMGILAVGAVPLLAGIAYFHDPAWVAFARERYLEQTVAQGYDSGRSSLVQRALELFDDHLWFGTGLDGFFALQGVQTAAEYPHNLVVATAAEGGLIGLGLLVAAVGAGAVALYRARPLDSISLGFALGALFVLVASQFSGDYYDSRFLWFLLGLAVIAARKTQQTRDHAVRGTPATRVVLARSAEGYARSPR
jgi:O-antigen ligase